MQRNKISCTNEHSATYQRYTSAMIAQQHALACVKVWFDLWKAQKNGEEICEACYFYGTLHVHRHRNNFGRELRASCGSTHRIEPNGPSMLESITSRLWLSLCATVPLNVEGYGAESTKATWRDFSRDQGRRNWSVWSAQNGGYFMPTL